MITDLKPYPAMKDSGVEWLGEVPEHWEVLRADSVLAPWKMPIQPEDVASERVLHYSIPNVQQCGGGRVEEGSSVDSGKLLVDRQLLLVSKLNPRKNTIALADPHDDLRTIASSEFVPMQPIHCLGTFARYLFSSEHVRLELSSRVDSATKSHQRCSPADITKLVASFPPLPEQAAIVRYLDHVDRRVRRLTRAKRKLIELLTEQKQAIIHRAVTRGLDPDVPLKDSGVEWLGEVPEHWEVVRSGHVINLLTGFPFKSEGFSKFEEDIRLLRGVNVTPGSLRWEDVVRWPSQQREELEAFQLETEDIILGMDRPIIAAGIRVTQVAHHDLPCLLVQRVARIRPRPGTDARFLLLLYAGKGFSDYLSPIFTGVSVPHLSPEQICSFRIAMPPIEEQEAIVEHLHGATENIDTTISRAEREIDLLNEYRTRLIADVVTGKLDVRDAAAALPEIDPLAAEEDMEEDDQHSEENEVLLDPSDEEALA